MQDDAILFQPIGHDTTPRIGDLSAYVGTSFYQRHGKRIFDITLSLVFILLATPILVLVFLLVRLDGGPALFVQERIGRDGRRFPCLKFRTMEPDAEDRLARMCRDDAALAREWQLNQKLLHDPRITPLGRILRATSLDELPQLFNVLRGDMSLVGPRPFTPGQDALYRAAGGRGYYRVRPGLTGPWQVTARSRSSFAERVRHDEGYVARISLWRDLGLVARTAVAVLALTGR